MKADTSPARASIIVPCWNQRGFTELCFQALFRHTRPPWELIVVDNGSTDETAAYLAGVRDAAGVPVTVVTNARNLGFPRAINQGLQAARGEYLVLLNNDAVVTDGWLDQLIALTRVRPDNQPRRADVELRDPAPVGRGRALSRPGRDARVRPAWRDEHRGSGSPRPSSRASAC